MWSVTQAFLIRWLQWLSSLGTGSPQHGPLWATWIGLYQAGTPPVVQGSTQSSIIEASYDGYARLEAVWYPVYQSSGGLVTLQSGSLFFQPTDALKSQTITGVFLNDSPTGGTLFAGQGLPNPGQVLSSPLTILKVIPAIGLGYGPNYGGAVFET